MEKIPEKIDAAVIRTAIEKYCASSGDRLEFLAGENPVTFRLNGKETYTARVSLGYSRLNQGYYIKCQQDCGGKRNGMKIARGGGLELYRSKIKRLFFSVTEIS